MIYGADGKPYGDRDFMSKAALQSLMDMLKQNLAFASYVNRPIAPNGNYLRYEVERQAEREEIRELEDLYGRD